MSLRRFFRRRQWDRERARELESHLAHEADDNIARGMAPEEARRQAYVKFGNPTVIREEIWQMNSFPFLENMGRDIRYALRQLRKSPGFAITAILTLALGIGISAAMFTVVDGVLLRPLPVPHPSEIVALGEASNSGGIDSSSLPDLRDWRADAKSFQDITWYSQKFFDLKKADGSAQFSINAETSANFFSTLQAHSLIGRTFLPAADNAGNQGSVVLSYYVWKNNFHADKNIVGQTVHLGPDPYTVIGVMPQHFYFGINDDGPIVWTVLAPTPAMEQRSNGFLNGIGRLRPGVTIAAARAELSGIQANIAKQYASQHLTKTVAVENYRDTLVGSVRLALLALLGAVLVVWLIACANVAGLMLSRIIGRRREIAVRAALGASRGRIVGQFLAESLLLGGFGGLCGLGIAYGCLALLRHLINLHRSGDVALNWQVILLLIAFSIASGILFGTAPAFQAASADPQEALHDGSTGSGTGMKQLRLRNALIVGELALSLVLLVSAGLLLRTLYALREVNLGFNTQHLVVAQLLSKNGFEGVTPGQSTQDIRDTTYKPLLTRLQHLPGVESVAFSSAAPLANNVHFTDNFAVIGEPSSDNADRTAEIHAVTPEIYRTLEVPLLQGRFFNQQDRIGTPAVAIVNQAFARQYLGSQPLGKRLNLDVGVSTPSILKDAIVVGVVANTPQNTVGQAPDPEVDVDMYQVPIDDDFYPIFSLAIELVVRTEQQPQMLVATISHILSQMDTTLIVNSVQTMKGRIDSLLGSQSLAAYLLWLFAIAAVLIAAAGLYGLLSYSVRQRTREIGLRIALGAQRQNILRMILRQAGRLLGVGMLIGILGAYFATKLLRSFLYGVRQHDLATIIAVSTLLIGVGLLASYIPARRAASIDPMQALRAE